MWWRLLHHCERHLMASFWNCRNEKEKADVAAQHTCCCSQRHRCHGSGTSATSNPLPPLSLATTVFVQATLKKLIFALADPRPWPLRALVAYAGRRHFAAIGTIIEDEKTRDSRGENMRPVSCTSSWWRQAKSGIGWRCCHGQV